MNIDSSTIVSVTEANQKLFPCDPHRWKKVVPLFSRTIVRNICWSTWRTLLSSTWAMMKKLTLSRHVFWKNINPHFGSWQEETGGSIDIRDEGLLEAALENAFSGFGGQEFYPSKEEKGARLGYELISNHAFVDGNKQIGMYVIDLFGSQQSPFGMYQWRSNWSRACCCSGPNGFMKPCWHGLGITGFEIISSVLTTVWLLFRRIHEIRQSIAPQWSAGSLVNLPQFVQHW